MSCKKWYISINKQQKLKQQKKKSFDEVSDVPYCINVQNITMDRDYVC